MKPVPLFVGFALMVIFGLISGEHTQCWVGLGLMWMGFASL